jgi:uncharacterized membrane protein
MDECLSPSWPVTWTQNQLTDQTFADDQACNRLAALAGVVTVTGNTRRLTHVCGGLLAAVLVGAATVTAALAVTGKPTAIGFAGLLVPVVLSWLVAAVMLAVSETPVSRTFGEIRWMTGAPVDPSAPWSPLIAYPSADAEVTWDYVVALIAAATRQHARTRLALAAAVVTTALFLLWMTLSLAAVMLA